MPSFCLSLHHPFPPFPPSSRSVFTFPSLLCRYHSCNCQVPFLSASSYIFDFHLRFLATWIRCFQLLFHFNLYQSLGWVLTLTPTSLAKGSSSCHINRAGGYSCENPLCQSWTIHLTFWRFYMKLPATDLTAWNFFLFNRSFFDSSLKL